MKDVYKNPLEVGDFVAFVQGSNHNPRIQTGHITKIYDNGKACTVNQSPHIYGYRILKLPKELECTFSKTED